MPILQRQNVNEYKKCAISSLCTKQREAINVLSLFESIDLTKTFKQIKHSGDSTMRLSFSSTFFASPLNTFTGVSLVLVHLILLMPPKSSKAGNL